MSKERVTADELLEAARVREDLNYDFAALADFARDEALERDISFNELVNQEAMALGEHMLRLNNPLRVWHLLGGRALGIEQKKYKKLHDYHTKYLITPVLMQVKEEIRGQTLMHGRRFKTRAAKDSNNPLKLRKVLSVEIIDHMAVLGSDVEPIEEVKKLIRLQASNQKGEIVPIPYFIMGDLDDPELLDIYALLNIARRELGDKTVK